MLKNEIFVTLHIADVPLLHLLILLRYPHSSPIGQCAEVLFFTRLLLPMLTNPLALLNLIDRSNNLVNLSNLAHSVTSQTKCTNINSAANHFSTAYR